MRNHPKLTFYLFLPLVALPFVTIAFACLGGGSNENEAAAATHGLNLQLPAAQVASDSSQDKLSFYAQAVLDSTRREQQQQNDPYAFAYHQPVGSTEDDKVAALTEIAYSPQRYQEPISTVDATNDYANAPKPATIDPEIAAINESIEKLTALQRPVGQPAKETTVPAMAVLTGGAAETSYFGKTTAPAAKGFLGEAPTLPVTGSLIATIPSTQVLQSGSVVKMRISREMVIGGHRVPAETMVYGLARMDNERLQVRVSSIRSQEQLFPVNLTVYDLDGMEGIYFPGSITREVLKSAADQSLQSVNMISLDPGVSTQATLAGIGAIKSLLSRKVRAVRVTVVSGYQVYLRDNSLK